MNQGTPWKGVPQWASLINSVQGRCVIMFAAALFSAPCACHGVFDLERLGENIKNIHSATAKDSAPCPPSLTLHTNFTRRVRGWLVQSHGTTLDSSTFRLHYKTSHAMIGQKVGHFTMKCRDMTGCVCGVPRIRSSRVAYIS